MVLAEFINLLVIGNGHATLIHGKKKPLLFHEETKQKQPGKNGFIWRNVLDVKDLRFYKFDYEPNPIIRQ